MNNTHVKLETDNGNLIVTALSAEAKEMFRDTDTRTDLYNDVNLLIDNFLIKHGYK